MGCREMRFLMRCFRGYLAMSLSVCMAFSLWMTGSAAYAAQLKEETGVRIAAGDASGAGEGQQEGSPEDEQTPADVDPEGADPEEDIEGEPEPEGEEPEVGEDPDDPEEGDDGDVEEEPTDDETVDPADPATPEDNNDPEEDATDDGDSDDEEQGVNPEEGQDDPVDPTPEDEEEEVDPEEEPDPEDEEEADPEQEEEAEPEDEDEEEAVPEEKDEEADSAEDDKEEEKADPDKPADDSKHDEKDEKKADEKDKDSELAVKSNGQFTDVPKSHWAYSVIKRAAKLGLIMGYSGDHAGEFGPDDGITRAQVVVILWRLAGEPKDYSGAKSFSDVSSGDYYYKAVGWASANRVVSGYGGEYAGMFGPNDPVTREQLATMLANYADRIEGVSIDGYESSYSAMTDADTVSSYARSSLGWCYAYGLMTGGNGSIMPKEGATRAQAAKMVVALHDRVKSPWQLSVSVSSTLVHVGEDVTIYPSISGESGAITFTYAASLGSWSSSLSSPTLTLSDAGTYQLTVRAKDEKGRTQAASIAVISFGLETLEVSQESETEWSASASTSNPGIEGVEYRFTWEKADGSNSGVLQDWSGITKVNFTRSDLGNALGKVNITVEARDDYGSLGSLTKTIQVEAMDDMTRRAQSFSSDTDYLILADCGNNWVGIYEGYKGNWTRIKHFRCTSGAPWTPTIKGTFTVGIKGYSFGSGYTCYYYTQFYGDFLFHSILYDEGTFNVQDGRLGESLSHGCVRLAIENAKWIYDNIPYGSTVHTYA